MKKNDTFFADFYDRFNKNTTIIILLIALVISISAVFLIELNSNILNLISVVLSITIGLMFTFFSSLSDRISSQHLSIKYKFKENRLIKLERSYKSSYFSIYICILCLIICLILITFPMIHYYIVKILTILLIFLLLQMFLSFYYVLNDMKEFIQYDITEEKKIINKKRLEEMDKDD